MFIKNVLNKEKLCRQYLGIFVLSFVLSIGIMMSLTFSVNYGTNEAVKSFTEQEDCNKIKGRLSEKAVLRCINRTEKILENEEFMSKRDELIARNNNLYSVQSFFYLNNDLKVDSFKYIFEKAYLNSLYNFYSYQAEGNDTGYTLEKIENHKKERDSYLLVIEKEGSNLQEILNKFINPLPHLLSSLFFLLFFKVILIISYKLSRHEERKAVNNKGDLDLFDLKRNEKFIKLDTVTNVILFSFIIGLIL